MTPDDLAAIRERDAADDLYRLTSGNLSTEGEKVTALMGALMDRRALLAEVDRLTTEKVHLINKWQAAERDVIALRSRVLPSAAPDPGTMYERARILPVIGAARALVNTVAEPDVRVMWANVDALRAALAAWEEGR